MEKLNFSEYINLTEVGELHELLFLYSAIPFDIFFKRDSSPNVKIMFVKGSFLKTNQRMKVSKFQDNFYILKSDLVEFNNENTYDWEKLFIPGTFSEKSKEIRSFFEFFLNGEYSIGRLLRSFHSSFPLKNEIYEYLNDDEIIIQELMIFFGVCSYIASGLTGKNFIENFVNLNRHNIQNENNTIKTLKSLKPPLYKNQEISFIKVLDEAYKETILFSQLSELFSNENRIEEAG